LPPVIPKKIVLKALMHHN